MEGHDHAAAPVDDREQRRVGASGAEVGDPAAIGRLGPGRSGRRGAADPDPGVDREPVSTRFGRARGQLGHERAPFHLPGHFPGSSALHWADGPGGRNVLLTGDSPHIAGDGRHVSVMRSVPNYIPVGPSVIEDLQRRLAGLDFDDRYGFTWGLNIIGEAGAAVDETLGRYLAAIAG